MKAYIFCKWCETDRVQIYLVLPKCTGDRRLHISRDMAKLLYVVRLSRALSNRKYFTMNDAYFTPQSQRYLEKIFNMFVVVREFSPFEQVYVANDLAGTRIKFYT